MNQSISNFSRITSSFNKLDQSLIPLLNPVSFSNDNLGDLINQGSIEQIMSKYITKKSKYINNIIDIQTITKKIFASKKIQSFINLYSLTIQDFLKLIINSEIVYPSTESGSYATIFSKGQKSKGYYILLQGELIIMTQCNINICFNNEYDISLFKEEILKEYNLNKEDVLWNNNHKNNNILGRNSNNFELMKNSFRNSFIKTASKSVSNIIINNDMFIEENYLCKYKVKNVYEDAIFFGGTNLFNDYLIVKNQTHLSSSYINLSNDTILLYIKKEGLQNLLEKIKKRKKNLIKFLLINLKPLKEMTSLEYNIKLIHVKKTETFIINNKKYPNTFFLIYEGNCYEKNNKNLIYDKGDFLYLNNLFLDDINNEIELCPKYSEIILFIIDLSYLTDSYIKIMETFLYKMFIRQSNIRDNVEINKLRYISLKQRNEIKIKNEEKLNENITTISNDKINKNYSENKYFKLYSKEWKNSNSIDFCKTSNAIRKNIGKNNTINISKFSIDKRSTLIVNDNIITNLNKPNNNILNKIEEINSNPYIDKRKMISSKIIREGTYKKQKEVKVQSIIYNLKNNISKKIKNNIIPLKNKEDKKYESIIHLLNSPKTKQKSNNYPKIKSLVSKKLFLNGIKNIIKIKTNEENKETLKKYNHKNSLFNRIDKLSQKNLTLPVFKKKNICRNKSL